MPGGTNDEGGGEEGEKRASDQFALTKVESRRASEGVQTRRTALQCIVAFARMRALVKGIPQSTADQQNAPFTTTPKEQQGAAAERLASMLLWQRQHKHTIRFMLYTREEQQQVIQLRAKRREREEKAPS